jgi:polyisoprenoid-binding protein YceI
VTRICWLLLSLLPVLAPGAGASQAASDTVVYQVDPTSRLVVKTGKAGLFGFAGHTHVIRARTVSGRLVYHPGAPTSSLLLKVPTESLEVLTPPDTAEIRQVTEAMREDVLQVDKFPEMTFAADALAARSGKMELQLAVTMAGVTRKVPVTAVVTVGADSIRARGSFTTNQTDFGIKPYSGGPAGTVKVANKVTFCFDLVALRDLDQRARKGPVPAAEAVTVPGCRDNAKAQADTGRRTM